MAELLIAIAAAIVVLAFVAVMIAAWVNPDRNEDTTQEDRGI